MARKRKQPGFSVPAWYAKLTPGERAAETWRIRRSVKMLRRYTSAFDADKGYDLRDVRNLSAARRRAITRAAADLHSRLSVPHVTITTKNKRLIRDIQKYQPQRIRGQRRFIIPVPSPDTTRVTTRGGRLTFLRTLSDGTVLEDRFFFLPRRAKRFKDVMKMLRKMLPAMPAGSYGVLMEKHGLILDTATKSKLPDLIQRWWAQYDGVAGKGETPAAIIGFQYIADSLDESEKFNELRRTERDRMQSNLRKRERNERYKAMRKLAREYGIETDE